MTTLLVRDLGDNEHELHVQGRQFGSEPFKATSAAGTVRERLDLREGYAVPGLVDSHAHLSGSDVATMAKGDIDPTMVIVRHARQHAAAGVLLVADKGTRWEHRDAFPKLNDADQPEIVRAGPMVTVPGGY